eukprot:5447416-Amphidinium_carterae.2
MISIHWISRLLRIAPVRQLLLSVDNLWPFLLYTDGSAERVRDGLRLGLDELKSGGNCQQILVGAVLWHPRRHIRLQTAADIRASIVKTWVPKKQQIGQACCFIKTRQSRVPKYSCLPTTPVDDRSRWHSGHLECKLDSKAFLLVQPSLERLPGT